MKMSNSNFEKFVVIAITFFGIGLLLGAILMYALAQSVVFYIADDVSSASSFTVWKEGNVILAKDAYGNIKYNGTNAGQAIQNLINSMASGRITVKPATYIIESPISLKSNMEFIMEKGAILKASDSLNIYVLNVRNKTNFVIEAEIDGNGINQHSINRKYYPELAYGMLLENCTNGVVRGTFYNSRAENIHIKTCKNLILDVVTGVTREPLESISIYDSRDIKGRISSYNNTYQRGVYVDATYLSELDCYGELCGDGVFLNNSQHNIVRAIAKNNTWQGVKMQNSHYNDVTFTSIENGMDGLYAFRCTFNTLRGVSFYNKRNGVWINEGGDNTYDIIARENSQLASAFASGMKITNSSNNIGTLISDDQPPVMQKYAFEEAGASNNNDVIGGKFAGWVVSAVSLVGNATEINVIGFVTKNMGYITTLSSAQVTVAHGLAGTPTLVLVTPRTTQCGLVAVTARNETTFTICVEVSGNWTLDWYAEYDPVP
jgi:hypothetical protein